MVKTGGSITDVLSFVAIVLPLFPILIIFLRRSWRLNRLKWLAALCFIAFIQQVLPDASGISASEATFINRIGGLGEFILVFYLLRGGMPLKQARDSMTMFLISFCSVIITLYALPRVSVYIKSITAIQSAILIFTSLIVILILIRNRSIIIFRESLFWIAGSTLCYYSMRLFIDILTEQQQILSMNIEQEKFILLSMTNAMRFILLAIAAYVAR